MNSSLLVPVLVALAAGIVLLFTGKQDFTKAERQIIDNSGDVMYVTTMPGDSAVLRAQSKDLSAKELKSERFRKLIGKMLTTVQDPSQNGVGIAAPQVGINRRIVCVQRFDKEGEPFEAYVNVKLDSLWGEKVSGREGCLSLPGLRGYVSRYQSVLVSYIDRETLQPRKDTVHGYTAVIFQHECDHLDGILYTDRADTVFVVDKR
ncbi:MAG: peptide deformylase [Bacteroidales bacterium]|nr:peptide deformylase [Bacteroidales bacterium]